MCGGIRPIRPKLVLAAQPWDGLVWWDGLKCHRGAIRPGADLGCDGWDGWDGWVDGGGGAVAVPGVGERVFEVALGLSDGESDRGGGDLEVPEQVPEAFAGQPCRAACPPMGLPGRR